MPRQRQRRCLQRHPPLIAELEASDATALVHDALYDDELRANGLTPYDNTNTAGAIVHTDHAAYTDFAPANLPGVQAIIDGRNMLDPTNWIGVRLRILDISPELD